MKKLLNLLTLVIFIILPFSAQAAVFLSDEKTISPPNAIRDDVYAAGDEVLLDKDITGDVFAAGNNVSVTGNVTQDLYAAGNSVAIEGTVGDDVFAAGNTVRIAAKNASDLFAAGSIIRISPEATFAGDAYLAGQDIEIAGTFTGDIRVTGDNLTIKSGTSIAGDVISYGTDAPVIEEGVTIGGERRHEVAQKTTESPQDRLYALLLSIISWFATGLLALYLLPGLTTGIVASAKNNVGRSFGLGLVWLLLAVPVSLLLGATIIGLPLMAILLLCTALSLMAALVYSKIIIGEFVLRQLFKVTTPLSWQHVLVGVAVYKLLALLPVIGWVFAMLLTILTFGIVLQKKWQLVRNVTPVNRQPEVVA